jgi:ferredoxin
MDKYFIQKKDTAKFLDNLSRDYGVYVPYRIKGKEIPCDLNLKLPTDDYLLESWDRIKKEDFTFNEYRAIEPLRTFFAFPKERLRLDEEEKKAAIFGVKNCDLFSLKIQDFVFLDGEARDPFYERRRQNALLISGDCPSFKETCFCRSLDINPYPSEGFDINFSPLDENFLVDTGSQRGEEIIKSSGLFNHATPAQISRRDEKRNSVVKRLTEHLAFHQIPPKDVLQEIVRDGYESDVWREEASSCVECGGCNLSCDTCHCFLLSEDRLKDTNEKIRAWDACLYANFARVAGGANPLKRRYQRLRNRYLKKFDFFPDNIKLNACCGCGRCIDVCPGKIDIRRILRRLNEEKSVSAH